MDEIIIKQISVNEIKIFLKLAFDIYKDDPYWVPPLFMDKLKILNKHKNPFFINTNNDMELFIAYKNDAPVGRIAAIKNDTHNKIHNENVGFFGFFESINDQNVANKLLDTAKDWLKKQGFSAMRGPTNPTSNDEYGALLEGFDDTPRLLMSYNPKYYLNLYDNYGMKKAKDLYAYDIQNSEMKKNEKIKRVNDLVIQRYGLKIRSVNMKNFHKELDLFKMIWNKTWAPNWGFIPMSEAEIDAAAKDLKPLINPDFVFFAEIKNEVIGMVLAMPDYNQIFKSMKGRLFPFQFLKLFTQKKKITWARVIALGVLPEYQKKGIDGVLYYECLVRAAKHGITQGEASWILEDNLMMNRGAETMKGRIYKKYRIYEKEI
ncbi:MAG: GNAT family N-acetyltransferase [Ignavibacteriae bacterium]|nr:GNAT family N-acetyltransferase [Ignavibacteriota bacterium]